MDDIDRNLGRYLETERLLNAFFAAFDFCRQQCIGPARQHNAGEPVAVCCRDKYHVVFDLQHAAFDRLRTAREQLYGKPDDHLRADAISPCEYHDPDRGCILQSHKSPVCLAFLCRKAIDRLRAEFGITFYDYLGINYALEWILTGILPEGQYQELKNNLAGATESIMRRITVSGAQSERPADPRGLPSPARLSDIPLPAD